MVFIDISSGRRVLYRLPENALPQAGNNGKFKLAERPHPPNYKKGGEGAWVRECARHQRMNVLKGIILGIVQGLTEFLPISSSGHLSLFQYMFGMSGEDSLMITVLLHIGTLLAVFICFKKTIIELVLEAAALVKDIFARRFSWKDMNEKRRMLFYFVISCVPLLFLLIPAGGGENIMDKVAVFSNDGRILAEGICFLFTGVLLIFATWRYSNLKKNEKMNPLFAFIVGVAQVIAAAFPGISRSGSTIGTGMALGVKKEYMVRYSFILGIPAILAANVVELKDAVETGAEFEFLPILFGVIFATITGILAIKLIQYILKKDLFKYFGYYCLVIGVVAIIANFVRG
ncbi:MAG: undecaprenyl-diphosphate phosphatase [Oscillospiraceae bacterium]|jgi:undecaprenyl-diphosphatase|nr:undecaprenyl-diphosphate phosphatase [Oscillospiraceae bacterium]